MLFEIERMAFPLFVLIGLGFGGCSGDTFSARPGVGGVAAGAAAGVGGGQVAGGGGVAGDSRGGKGGVTAGGLGGAAGSGSGVPRQVQVREAHGLPLPRGIVVIANDIDGNLADHATLDTQGATQLQIPVGGSVSALGEVEEVTPTGTYRSNRVVTRADLLSDGAVEVVVEWGVPVPSLAMNVTATLNSSIPDATGYSFRVSCSNAFPGVGPALESQLQVIDCDGTQHFDVFVFAYDAQYQLVGWGSALEQRHVPGRSSTLAITVANTQVGSLQVKSTDLPVDSSSYRTQLWGVSSRHPSGSHFLSGEELARFPDGLFDGFIAQQSLFFEHPTLVQGLKRQHRLSQPPPTEVAWSASGYGRVGQIGALELDIPQRPAYEYTIDGPLFADCVRSEMFATNEVAKTTKRWETAHAARSTRRVVFPQLPPGLEGFIPTADDLVSRMEVHAMTLDSAGTVEHCGNVHHTVQESFSSTYGYTRP